MNSEDQIVDTTYHDVIKTIPQLNIATSGKRFLNLILDMIFYYIFVIIVGFILGILIALKIINPINPYIVSFSALFIYYTFLEAFGGRTVGKLITGTKVVNKEGSKITFIQAFLRTICRNIPFEALSFFGDKGRPVGWHDLITGTRVIDIRKKTVS